MRKLSVLLLCVLALAGCKTTVLTQNVPISTDPLGATVYSDGKEACTTPCSVELERNRDHLLTMVKPGYAQVDVEIRREYRSDAMFDVVREGLKGGLSSPGRTIDEGMDKIDEQKKTGEAYVLEPQIVRVRLWVEGSQPPPDVITAPRDGLESLDPTQSAIGLLRRTDTLKLMDVLERSPSGVPTSWSNAGSGVRFTVVPENGRGTARIVRWFTLTATGPQGVRKERSVATRFGYGDWRIGLNQP